MCRDHLQPKEEQTEPHLQLLQENIDSCSFLWGWKTSCHRGGNLFLSLFVSLENLV